MKTRCILNRLTLLATLLLTSCASPLSDQFPATSPTDHELVRHVRLALYKNGLALPMHISVSAKKGVVTLTGTVNDAQAAQDAEVVAHHVSGVKDVINEIKVKKVNADLDELNQPAKVPVPNLLLNLLTPQSQPTSE